MRSQTNVTIRTDFECFRIFTRFPLVGSSQHTMARLHCRMTSHILSSSILQRRQTVRTVCTSIPLRVSSTRIRLFLDSVEVDHSYNRTLLPAPFILGTTIVERQLAGGSFQMTGSTSSNGNSNNTFNYVDSAGNTYTRQVNASRDVITFDSQGGSLAPSPVPN